MPDDELTRRIEAHAAWQALENGCPQLLLEILDATIEGGSGEIELLRRAADGAGARHHINIAQKPHVAHGLSQVMSFSNSSEQK